LPIPNSAARLTFVVGTGGASLSLPSTLDLIKLGARGGGGLEVSGPENDCLRPRDEDLDEDLLVDRSSIVSLSFDGLLIRGPGPGSDGLLVDGWPSLLNGNV
jgi:hypothetical protein